MASNVTPETATSAAPRVEDSGKPLVERPPSQQENLPYPLRFRLAYFALAIVLGAAVGGFVLFMGWPDSNERPFSTWEPTANGEERAWQIADHVSSRYRHPSGTKLVEVTPRPPFVQMAGANGQREDVPISTIFVRGRASDFSDAEATRISQDNTVMFALCGGGQRCAMDEGTPSRERGALLRREVLELALYAYEYDDELETVIALLPPVRTTNEQGQPAELQRLVYFRRPDLERALEVPVGTLLPGRPSLSMPPQVTQRVNRLVVRRQYQYAVEPGQLGDALLILSPFTG